LLERVWRLSPDNQTRTVDVFMSRLRRYIESDDGGKVLVTVRGEGYRLLIPNTAS
jgi:DNA-binding response OmpR family regulator